MHYRPTCLDSRLNFRRGLVQALRISRRQGVLNFHRRKQCPNRNQQLNLFSIANRRSLDRRNTLLEKFRGRLFFDICHSDYRVYSTMLEYNLRFVPSFRPFRNINYGSGLKYFQTLVVGPLDVRSILVFLLHRFPAYFPRFSYLIRQEFFAKCFHKNHLLSLTLTFEPLCNPT